MDVTLDNTCLVSNPQALQQAAQKERVRGQNKRASMRRVKAYYSNF